MEELRQNVKIALQGEAGVNGESLENLKPNKQWVRSGGHGRATEVGDIAVERLRDAEGKVIEGKYKMTAVIEVMYSLMRLPKRILTSSVPSMIPSV